MILVVIYDVMTRIGPRPESDKESPTYVHGMMCNSVSSHKLVARSEGVCAR